MENRKKICALVISFFLTANMFSNPIRMDVAIKSNESEKMKLLIGVIESNDFLERSSHLLKDMLSRSKALLSGFSVKHMVFDKQPSKSTMKKLSKEGFGLGLFVSLSKKKRGDDQADINEAEKSNAVFPSIDWRLYDLEAAQMIKGKRFIIKQYPERIIAEHIADQVWPLLTGQSGFFSTRVAYCKEHRAAGKKIEKHIYVTVPYVDCADSLGQSLTLVARANAFAPRWNNDARQPMILYSEITPSNVRLMSVAMDKKRKIVANLDGFITRPSFSSDGKKVVYCSCDGSIGNKSNIYKYRIDDETGRPSLERITYNNGQNISPTLCDNGDIIFCSDAASKQPYICYYHADTKMVERITADGYCTSPSFCALTQKIVYARMCSGVSQLFSYDLNTKEHMQLTFDALNKDEPCWSPCGNYVAFTVNTGRTSRIAVHHLISNERIYVTSSDERCSYPTWSPHYEQPIVI